MVKQKGKKKAKPKKKRTPRTKHSTPPRVEKVSPATEPPKVEEEEGSAVDFLNRVIVSLDEMKRHVEDAISEIKEEELNDAVDSVMKAMDLLGKDVHHKRLDKAAEMISDTKLDIEEKMSELL